uniref:Uncharacterized protein n=1 Tax=Arion vulgaris TaxID=1028688 RepID=A0A0B6ZD74_9EUPU
MKKEGGEGNERMYRTMKSIGRRAANKQQWGSLVNVLCAIKEIVDRLCQMKLKAKHVKTK